MVIQTYLAYKYGSQPVAVSWDDSCKWLHTWSTPNLGFNFLRVVPWNDKCFLGIQFFPDFPMDQTLGFKSFDSRKRCSQSSPIILDCITPYQKILSPHNHYPIYFPFNTFLGSWLKNFALCTCSARSRSIRAASSPTSAATRHKSKEICHLWSFNCLKEKLFELIGLAQGFRAEADRIPPISNRILGTWTNPRKVDS